MPPDLARALARLPHRRPREGRDYWLIDDALPDPAAVRARAATSESWVRGAAVAGASWPGMRLIPALAPDELAGLEAKVCALLRVRRLRPPPSGASVDHNCLQVVGEREAGPKPHTDSRAVCDLAGVIHLLPTVPERCGTSFYRVRLPDGSLGGNMPTDGADNLVEALGTRQVPVGVFVEELRIPARYNRLLVYRAELIHSATAYCGIEQAERRMTAVFFWRS